MAAVYIKEIKSYFTSMTGSVFAAFMIMFGSFYFVVYNLRGAYTDYEYTLASMIYILLIVIPIISMRLYSEEKRQKTDQLLLTSPISVTSIVLGKYFAVITLFALPTAFYALFPAIIRIYAPGANTAPAFATLFGFFLLGAAALSVGMFISCLTESLVISAVVCFAVLLICFLMQPIITLSASTAFSAVLVLLLLCAAAAALLYFVLKNKTAAAVTGAVCAAAVLLVYFLKIEWITVILTKLLSVFALFIPFYQFAYGIFDYTSVLYYLSVTAVMLFLSVQAIKKHRLA